MNPALDQFLAARFPFPGLAAWGVRFRDRTVASRSYVRWLPSARAEEVLARLVLAAEGLGQHRLEPLRLCYRFEHLRCRLAVRADGHYLALIVQNLREASERAEQSALEDFANLPELRPDMS